MRRASISVLALVVIEAMLGCSGDGKTGGSPADAAGDRHDAPVDLGRDTGRDTVGDAGSDVPDVTGGGEGSVDGGADAPLDAPADASPDLPAEAGTDAGIDVPLDGDLDAPGYDGSAMDTSIEAPASIPVRVDFTGEVVTVAGTPLGLDSTARLARVSGSFTYDMRVGDTRPQDSMRGYYLHNGTSVFTFTVLSHTVTGSGKAIVEVENLTSADTFRFLDGPQIDQVPRIMKLDDTDAPTLKLNIAISGDDNSLFSSDMMPNPFPTIDITKTSHTFGLQHGTGNTLLMQLDTLVAR